MAAAPLADTRIGILGRGGAGKSTLTILLARGLLQAGYRPVILDADSTNLGLPQALGMGSVPKALVDHFGGMVFSGGAVTCPVDDPTSLPGSELELATLPRQFLGVAAGGIRMLVAGKMGELGPGAGCDGPIAKIARDLRIREPEGGSVLLIDFKAGFEDPARGVLTGLDWALVVVDPSTAGLYMAVHLQRMVRKIADGTPPATAHLDDPGLAALAIRQFRESRLRGVHAVLNKIPDHATEAFLRAKLGDLGGPPILGSVPADPRVELQWLRGEIVGTEVLEEKARALALALDAAVVPHLAPA
jgi:CO dehydrogenase maturation factor